MRTIAILALSLTFALPARAQDPPKASGADPSVAELQRQLELQRQEIEALKQEASRTGEQVRQMQKLLEQRLGQTTVAKPPETAVSVAATSPTPGGLGASKPAVSQAGADPNAPWWAVLKINDAINFRFSALVQPWYEAIQDPNSGGYSQNFFLRRARFSILGTLPSGISVFFQVENARVGNAGTTGIKNVSSGFQILDAFGQWAFLGKAAKFQAGLFLVPTIRQILTRYSTFLALDVPTWSIQEGPIEQSTLGRDYGIGLNGALLDNERLSYRVGVFSGYRAPSLPQSPPFGPAAGARNAPRFAGRLMYDFCDPEAGYSYIGTYLGKRRVASIAFVGDGQGDYRGFGGDAFFDWPLGPGAVTAEADYMRFDGGRTIYNIGGVPTRLPEQQTFYTNEGYYFSALKLQPFFRYETLTYSDPADRAKEQERIGGGFNYYVLGQNFKATGYYERIMPKVQPTTASIKDFNRFVLQFQGFF